METPTPITVSATINAPIEKVWLAFTTPEHIVKWNKASDDWHTPIAENDLKVGGKFLYRMEAKDGSVGFDFWGNYTAISTNEFLSYTMGDGRMVTVNFTAVDNQTKVEETFEAENTNPIELQHDGWQAILNNLKQYTEQL